MKGSFYPKICVQNSTFKDSYHVEFLDFKSREKIEDLDFFQIRKEKKRIEFFGCNRNIYRMVFFSHLFRSSINSFVLRLNLSKVVDDSALGFTRSVGIEFNPFQIEKWHHLLLAKIFFAPLNSG